MTRGYYRLAAAMSIALALSAIGYLSARGREEAAAFFEVRRGVFEVTLLTEGDLEAVDKRPISAPFNGEILRLLKVGERVAAGETVLQMATEGITNDVENGGSQLRELEAQRVKTEESVSKQLNSAELDIRRAEIELRLAELRKEETDAGPTEEERLDTERNLKSCTAICSNRAEELDILRTLAEKGFVTQDELEQKRLEIIQGVSALEKARAQHATVMAGSSPSKREDASLQVRIAEIELERARKGLESLKEVTKAQVEKAVLAEERKRRDLDELRDNLTKADVAAPVDGIVLMERRDRWRQWRQGDWVWEQAKVLTIPSLARMKLVGNIDENDIALVKDGQEVRVRLPFAPGRTFKGKVTRSAPLGKDAHARFGERTRERLGEAERQVFDVEMEMEQNGTELLPGLRAYAEIVVYRNESALAIPLSAVRSESGGDYVQVLGGAGPVEREIKPGRRNRVYVEVLSGLSEGDRLALREE